MSDGQDGKVGWIKLLDAILEQREMPEEDFMKDFLWTFPEEVQDPDSAAAQDREMEAALDRAFAVGLRKGKRLRRLERRERESLGGGSRSTGYTRVLKLLQSSHEARHRDPIQMAEDAREAREVAFLIVPEEHPPGVIHDLRARACAEYANALRVGEAYRDAAVALEEAWRCFRQGSGDRSLRARLLDIGCSIRFGLRRYDEALAEIDEAHQIYLEIGDRHLAGRALIKRGRVFQAIGEPAKAVHVLEEATNLLDRERDPNLMLACSQVLIDCLVDCRAYHRASQLLLESGLGEAFADQPLNRLRLRWVEAKIHTGLNRLPRAVAIYEEVRAGLKERELHYDAALAGLDLAALLLRMGETDRLALLTIEMAHTFRRLPLLYPDPWTALRVLKLACDQGSLSQRLIEKVQEFLALHRADPSHRLDLEALVG